MLKRLQHKSIRSFANLIARVFGLHRELFWKYLHLDEKSEAAHVALALSAKEADEQLALLSKGTPSVQIAHILLPKATDARVQHLLIEKFKNEPSVVETVFAHAQNEEVACSALAAMPQLPWQHYKNNRRFLKSIAPNAETPELQLAILDALPYDRAAAAAMLPHVSDRAVRRIIANKHGEFTPQMIEGDPELALEFQHNSDPSVRCAVIRTYAGDTNVTGSIICAEQNLNSPIFQAAFESNPNNPGYSQNACCPNNARFSSNGIVAHLFS